MKFNTKLLHSARDVSDHSGATLPAIHQSSAFAHESSEKLEKVFDNKAPGFAYTRIGNPTVNTFEKRMAEIEGGFGAVACASGMAAISMTLLAILKSGDEIISSAALFGGTLDLLTDLEDLGIHTTYVDYVTPESIEAQINANTKAVFTELIGNPRLDVVDVKAIAEVTKRYNIPLIIDATTSTPALIRPFEYGANIVIHSASKYISGSGNAISGIIIDSGRFAWDFEKYPTLARYKQMGKLAFTAKLKNDTWKNYGACLSPQNAYIGLVGLETLGLRMERLCDNALALAEALQIHVENHEIAEVTYPGLSSSRYKEVSTAQFEKGRAGAILTIKAGSKEKAWSIIDNLKYASVATNIGDVRTLVIHPASTIYGHSTQEQLDCAGVTSDLIRVSVGLEDIEDLIADFTQAIIT
ncbi:MAG: aminotransferase class I/II-fold pyridoxal phosphate-dependent enzyme [Clostridiales Family XIII bacterium]|jgi:O-acetylhomoserine (thiol)-lyase|nr:aminotransferase class I/II-fold pyridoxal phosphate-dependent enzyme [Clostridiales Family XIII bacterium]